MAVAPIRMVVLEMGYWARVGVAALTLALTLWLSAQDMLPGDKEKNRYGPDRIEARETDEIQKG